MARYSASIVSQTGQLTGMPSGLTVNGYMGYWGAAAGSGFILRRLGVGMKTSTAASIGVQQYALEIHRQTVAPAGTGIAASVAGQKLATWCPADPTAGVFAITSTAIGTTGPTLDTVPVKTIPLNTQSFVDYPWEFMEELLCLTGTANGFGFVITGASPIPATAIVTLDLEIEV